MVDTELIVQLYVSEFDVEADDFCRYDNLKVRCNYL